jgi:hypothetical protein
MTNKERIHPIPRPVIEVIEKLYPDQDSVLFTMYKRIGSEGYSYIEIPITYVKNRHTRTLWYQIKDYTDENLAIEVEKSLKHYQMDRQVISRVEALGGLSQWIDENGTLRDGIDIGTFANNTIRVVNP